MSEEDARDLLTVAEVARTYGVSLKTLLRWIENGRLPSIVSSAGVTLLRVSDVEALIVTPTQGDEAPES
ncbi:MAG: helix-turn-helix domain-containing protein [Actinomycetota bacterium]|nr:helix-turn-helix domain-containing protein [Actinomycetota bacterium]